MTLRTNLSPEQLEAHRILDLVRAGVSVLQVRVKWALVVLGDVE